MRNIREEKRWGKSSARYVVIEENKPEQNLNMDFFHDYKMVKPRLACRLINCEKNQELLWRPSPQGISGSCHCILLYPYER